MLLREGDKIRVDFLVSEVFEIRREKSFYAAYLFKKGKNGERNHVEPIEYLVGKTWFLIEPKRKSITDIDALSDDYLKEECQSLEEEVQYLKTFISKMRNCSNCYCSKPNIKKEFKRCHICKNFSGWVPYFDKDFEEIP